MIGSERTDRMLGLAALAILAAGCLLVLFPFITALLWAVILTYSTWPLFVRLNWLVGGRKTLAAALMTLATATVLLAPFVIVAVGLADNASELADALRDLIAGGLPELPRWLTDLPLIGERLGEYWRGLAQSDARLMDELQKLLLSARTLLISGGAYLAAGVAQLTLSVLVAFFLFRDGESAATKLQWAAARVGGAGARNLLDVAGQTVHGVVYGILGTALAQGILAGIGFLIAGVPGALLLGLATFFLSVVPVGPPLIWGSAAIWLYLNGDVGWTVFMVLWGLLVISLVDNFVKPMIISRGSSLPFVLVLLGVLGGVVAFGFIGVFLGPTLLAAGYRMLNEWIENERPERS
jgi:predicted PurR-regulated permease PerM